MNPIIFKPHYMNSCEVFEKNLKNLHQRFDILVVVALKFPFKSLIVVKRKYFVTKDSLSLE